MPNLEGLDKKQRRSTRLFGHIPSRIQPFNGTYAVIFETGEARNFKFGTWIDLGISHISWVINYLQKGRDYVQAAEFLILWSPAYSG